jgi:hypothetical protein
MPAMAEGGTYLTIVDAPWGDENRRRVQSDHLSAASQYDLYLQLARALQMPPFWYDPELEPFFPYPKPKVTWATRPRR